MAAARAGSAGGEGVDGGPGQSDGGIPNESIGIGAGGDSSLVESLQTSITLAVEVTVIAVVIGTLLSFGLAKASILVKQPVNALLLSLLTVPALILSAGLVAVFSWLGLSSTVIPLVLASVVTSLPFVVLVVSGRLQDLDPRFAEAARSLGAGPVRTFMTVTVPLMAPVIVAGGLLVFVMCFNNFAIQLFTAPIGVSTLPVQIYSMVRLGVTPDVNALGTIIVASTVVLIVLLHALTGNAAKLLTSQNGAR
ncbi:MAG: transporter permease [Frondihabitans sp.]|nr:transporter permease [Frondihabitans sp.]